LKPETALFLEKSRELFDQADAISGIGLHGVAGRTAYLAGMHAARGFIFETLGRVFKRHSTVQSEFVRMVKEDPRVDIELRSFQPRMSPPKAPKMPCRLQGGLLNVSRVSCPRTIRPYRNPNLATPFRR
jgi:uncharacterized protein (UPF0332 family)